MAPVLFDFVRQTTSVKEVDENGVTIGRTFFSANWDTRDRPADCREGCKQWFKTIVVADTLDAAAFGSGLVQAISTVASSSPSSRDVHVIHLDNQGNMTEEFQVPYVLVPQSKPSGQQGLEIASEIWFSSKPFTPVVTPVAELEQACNSNTFTLPSTIRRNP